MLHAMQHLFIKKDKINYRSRHTRYDLDEKKPPKGEREEKPKAGRMFFLIELWIDRSSI
jgi:hypothetical protein